MPIKFENVGIAVRDLEATIAFFTDLGLTVLGRDTISGEWADTAVGLDGNHANIAMLQTPDGNGRLEDILNPVGRIFCSTSTTICLPVSRSQEVDAGLGAQAGEARVRDVLTAAGFTHFRRTAETPVNLVFEARP